MKLPVLMIAVFSMVNATAYSQVVTLSLKDAPLVRAFMRIEQQTNYHFVYTEKQVKEAHPITIKVNKAGLLEVLPLLFRDQPFGYSISDQHNIYIVARNSTAGIDSLSRRSHLVRGRVTDEMEGPVPGVTILQEGTGRATSTNAAGEFVLAVPGDDSTFIFSSIGYETRTLYAKPGDYLRVSLKMRVRELDQAVVIAYGLTTRRLSTGNVTRISGDEIRQQPVSNPLAALEGRVPGLLITQSNGLPGSAFRVQLRGQTSIGVTPGFLPANDPLFIIDGVPFAPNNLPLNLVGSGTALGMSGRSPFNSIDPEQIESIEVLKDADATAIYGSRGANGVILITTRKLRPGKTRVTGNISTGLSWAANDIDMLNTTRYVQLRKEALANDGATPNASNAPDLVLWDTTRYTDFRKMFTGGTAHATDAQLAVSGGTDRTQLMMGAGYHHESTVFPGQLGDSRISFHVKANHVSSNEKFNATLSAIYSSDKNNLIITDLTKAIFLAPNMPSLRKDNGQLNWDQSGVAFNDNPLAELLEAYDAQTDNLLSNLQLSYRFNNNFVIRSSFGYNRVMSDENSIQPIASQNPINTVDLRGSSFFGGNSFKSWIVEPQAEYTRNIGRGKLNILAGSTWQQLVNNLSSIQATGYTNDELIRSISAASQLIGTNNTNQYHYQAVFGRINYNLYNRYIVNVSGRRDGSSRFGPGKRFGNFGAIGAAWIFSETEWVKKHVPLLTYGKLRGSYGSTGNDQIGDYKYLDIWTSTQYGYPADRGLFPSQLAVPDYSWEINHKLEFAIDIGLLRDRVLVAAAWFRNRSSNQLIAYKLPLQTGFANIAAKNFPAVVQNEGLETSVQTKNITLKKFTWSTFLNLTLPRNKLISFPNLSTSSYAGTLIEGQSLSVQKRFHYTGVDPATGLFTIQDVDRNGTIDPTNDVVIAGHLDTKLYGGLANSFTYGNWSLTFFLEFRKQLAQNYLSPIYKSFPPGTVYANQPVIVQDRWKGPGDQALIQRASASPSLSMQNAISNFVRSDGTLSDASFIRLKNVYLSYRLPLRQFKTTYSGSVSVYLRAQNIFTMTKYKNADPETQDIFSLPPLRTVSGGIQFSF